MIKSFNELKNIINFSKTKSGVQIKFNAVDPSVIQLIADHYGLHVFTPGEHGMNFTFCKGYYSISGEIQVSKRHAVGSFSLNDCTEFTELLESHEG